MVGVERGKARCYSFGRGVFPLQKSSGNFLSEVSSFSLFFLWSPFDSAWEFLGLYLINRFVKWDLLFNCKNVRSPRILRQSRAVQKMTSSCYRLSSSSLNSAHVCHTHWPKKLHRSSIGAILLARHQANCGYKEWALLESSATPIIFSVFSPLTLSPFFGYF